MAIAHVTEVRGETDDPDETNIGLTLDRALLPGVTAGEDVQVVPVDLPEGAGFRLLVITPVTPAPPPPTP